MCNKELIQGGQYESIIRQIIVKDNKKTKRSMKQWAIMTDYRSKTNGRNE